MTLPSNTARTPSMNDEIVKPLRRSAAQLMVQHDGLHAGFLRHAAHVAGVECVSAMWRKMFSGVAGFGLFLGARHVLLVSAVIHDLADEYVGAARERSRCSPSTPCRPRSKSSACSSRSGSRASGAACARRSARGSACSSRPLRRRARPRTPRTGSLPTSMSWPKNSVSGCTVRPSSTMRISTLARKNASAPSTVLRGRVRPVDVRRRRFAAGPLMRQHRREVRRVIVVQVREEHRAHGLIAEARGDERAHRAVAAVDEIRHSVDDDGAGAFAAIERHAGAAARAEHDEPRAGRRRGRFAAAGGCAASGSRSPSAARPAAPASTVRRVAVVRSVVAHLVDSRATWGVQLYVPPRGVMPTRLARCPRFGTIVSGGATPPPTTP